MALSVSLIEEGLGDGLRTGICAYESHALGNRIFLEMARIYILRYSLVSLGISLPSVG